jgi:hypothetical protein
MHGTESEVRFAILDRISEPGGQVLIGSPESRARPNEDVVGVTATAAWVIDGTTGPFDQTLTPGPSDASWLAQALNSVLLENYADLSADPEHALSKAAEQLRGRYARDAGPAPAHQQPSACLALAALSSSKKVHLFNIGDCRILVEKSDSVSRFGSSDIEKLETAAIAEIVCLRASEGVDVDPWPRLRSMLRHNFRTAMNHVGGYWVVHPTLLWRQAVQHVQLVPSEVDHVLIASDGFFRLATTFAAYDERGLVAAAIGAGLAALYAELRDREAQDPSCQEHPRLKAGDDASAVLIRVCR